MALQDREELDGARPSSELDLGAPELRVSGIRHAAPWPGLRSSDRVRTSDICVPTRELESDVSALDDLYSRGLRLVSEYSQQGGGAGRVLRVDPVNVEPCALREGLTWLYDKLADSGAYYPGAAGVELALGPGEQREQAWRALCALEARGVARAVATEPPPRAHARGWRVQLQSDGTLLVPASCREEILDVVLAGFIGSYHFRWQPGLDGHAPELWFAPRRAGSRARVSARVRAERSNPHEDLLVCDVSESGIGVACHAALQMIFPGQRFERLKIHWKGGCEIECDATVMHVSPRAVGGYDRCGLKLHLGPVQRARWTELVSPLLHPRTLLGRVSAETLLLAYEESGYLNLSGRRSEDFREQRQHFARAQARLQDAGDLGCAVAAGDAQRFEAFCHQLEVWPQSWLFYHLCRLPAGRSLGTCDDRVLVDLYARAYAYVQEQPGARWLVTYIQKSAGYSHRVHYQGALEASPLGGVALVPVRVHQLECNRDHVAGGPAAAQQHGLPSGASEGLRVGVATAAQGERIRSGLRRSLPHEYLAATGLDGEGLALASLPSRYADAGLERERCVWVAERGAELVACAIADAASPGLHLYGLLDCVRVFGLADVKGVDEQLTDALLSAAQRWYAALGRHEFCYFADPATALDCQRWPGRDLGEAYVVVQSVEHVPLLLERVFALAAPSLLGPNRPREAHERAQTGS